MKKNIDMLNGPMWNKIPAFALTIAATAVLSQLFNASDLAVVGNFTGSMRNIAVAAVGANSPIVSLILNLFIGISLGSNVIIASAIGCQNREEANKAVHTSIVFSVVGGVVTAVVSELLASPVLKLLNTPDEVFPLALLYLRIYLLGLPVIFLYNFEAAIFRSNGNTRTPLFALALSGVINVFLNLFFVIVLKMSVEGVAIATVISNAISAAILFFKLLREDDYIHLDLKGLAIDTRILKKIISIGLPAGIQSGVFSLANIIIQSSINSLGTVVIAASSAALNVEIFVYYIINSFAQACTTFVGQNYGAGQLDRCKKVYRISMIEDAIALSIAASFVLLFGKELIAIFNSDSEVVETGYIRLVMIMASYTCNFIYEVTSGYLRGYGISLVPSVLTTLGICGVRLVWIFTVFPQSRTFRTIMEAYPLSLFVTAFLVVSYYIYKRKSLR